MNATPTVFLIDDDRVVRNALTRLLHSAGFEVRTFQSASDFLSQHDPDIPGCLVLDVVMPDVDGLSVQRTLAASGCERFIVFISAHAEVSVGVEAMKAGAVDFLSKPIREEQFLAAICRALDKDRIARERRLERQAIQQRVATLTPREREVLHQVIDGRLNKQIAADLGTVEKTIKVHRARVMEKMGVSSVAELVRVALSYLAQYDDAVIDASEVRDVSLRPHVFDSGKQDNLRA